MEIDVDGDKGNPEFLDADPENTNAQRDQDLRQQFPFGPQRLEVIPESKPKHGQGTQQHYRAARRHGALFRPEEGNENLDADKGDGQCQPSKARSGYLVRVMQILPALEPVPERRRRQAEPDRQEDNPQAHQGAT